MATREFLYSAINQSALAAYKLLQQQGKSLTVTPKSVKTSSTVLKPTPIASSISTKVLRPAESSAYKVLNNTATYSGDGSSSWAGKHVMRGAFDYSSGVRKYSDYVTRNQALNSGKFDLSKGIGEYGRAVTKSMSAFDGVSLFEPHTSQDFSAFDAEIPTAVPGGSEGSHTYSDAEMRVLHEMISKWTTDGLSTSMLMDNFNRFYQIYPDAELPGNLKSYVFITRPEMNIYSGRSNTLITENKKDMVALLARTNPEILHMLTAEYTSDHDFIPFLQGRTQSLQEVDFQIKTADFTVPFYSYKYTYPTVTNESRTGGSFDITFREDDEMRVMKLFQFWIYYMDAINKDRLKVDDSHKKENRYDYMCSVYHFICDPTSEWILFWSKYTGCYPVSVPVSNLSFSLGDRIDNKVGITFNYMRAETLDAAIINDFLGNVHTEDTNFLDLHNDQFDLTGPSLSSCPIITLSDDGKKFLLKWLPYKSNGVASNSIGSTDSFNPRNQTELYSKSLSKVLTATKNTLTQLSQFKKTSASVISPQPPTIPQRTAYSGALPLASPTAGF